MSVSRRGGGGISGNGKWIDAGRDCSAFWGLIAGGVCYVVLNLIVTETDIDILHALKDEDPCYVRLSPESFRWVPASTGGLTAPLSTGKNGVPRR